MKKTQNKKNSFLVKVACNTVRWYQLCISPFIGGRAACRFTPTCSEYARLAIEKYGVAKGVWLGLKRISRCRPCGGCGYDPVP